MQPTPSFDSWTIIFLIAAVQGFFTAFMLWFWRNGHRQANRLLALTLILFSITMIEYVLFWTHYLYLYPFMANLSVQFPFFYGPVTWYYLRIVYEGKKLRPVDLWPLGVFLLALIPFLEWYAADTDFKSAVIQGRESFIWNSTLMWGQLAFRLTWIISWAIWNIYYVWKQPRVGQTSRWAWALSIFQFVFALAYLTYYGLIQTPWFKLEWDYHISAIMTAMIYMIAYAGYVQPAVFQGYSVAEPAAPSKYRNSGLTPEAGRSIYQKLRVLMVEEKLYTDPDISLDKLARRLDIGKHALSQVINELGGATFFEYINRLRVEDAKRLLESTTRQDFHVIEIAYQVGFNNKVSFNTAFKKETGMTPTAWRQRRPTHDGEKISPGAGSPQTQEGRHGN